MLRIVIVGGGTAGWMSAAAMVRLLDPRQYEIHLVESDAIGTVGVGEATLPHLKAFNDRLGIAEAEFMRRTQATFKLGIEFVGWDLPGQSYFHPFGSFGESWAGVEFQHHWTRAQALGLKVAPFQTYSYAAMACRSLAFELPNEDTKSIRSTYAHAYHIDAGLYAAFLSGWAIARGVRRTEGEIVTVDADPETGRIRGVGLKSGAQVAGDLFIDCSGFRALLIGETLRAPWEDWTHLLPCDRALALPSQRTGDFPPFTLATARRAGWTWRIPLQHRTGNGYVYSSQFISDNEAADTLMTAVGDGALGEPRRLRFRAGRRPGSWTRNCVAIGLASGFLEPLESTSIYLIQAALMDLMRLIPAAGRPDLADPRLAAEFNRLTDIQYERIRDFLILHYVANRRTGEPFWDHMRQVSVPDSLAHKMALFERRGFVPFYRSGLFSRDSWLAVLIGQGLLPGGFDPGAERIDAARLEERLAEFERRIAGNVDMMPPHATFVRQYCAAEAPMDLRAREAVS